jgi:hypothetical protein
MVFSQDEGPLVVLSRFGVPIFAMAMMWLLLRLPGNFINFFTVWLLVSFPIGVLIGHGVLNED